ncbi:PQQ-dependent sugar dehydrogenase [Pseudonocardia asaccharolytica]|uniref:PQQ-dependent sugar dehydrogenase n=1 Tax=Pseudonocardia asaccharolytica TaxID=54010 RepID=UPI0006841167|nr:PQQ-dependent sugar dehydrogenase [Pseudonocardia asaccharolytica]
MRRRTVRVLAAVLLGLMLAACASFPDSGPREWRDKIEGAGELGGPPSMLEPPPPGGPDGQQGGEVPERGREQAPSGCDDPDPQVVATCLDPIGAIAVLPDSSSALVGERSTGRVLRVERGVEPQLVTTVPVDPRSGGLTGLVLSPSYAEDRLVYAYASTPEDNRVLRLAPGEPPKPVLTGIPRGPADNGGALGTDTQGALVVATGAAGGAGADPRSLAGKVLRIDTLGRPMPDNPDPASPIFSSGLRSPQGVCTDRMGGTTWVTDRAATQDVLYRVGPGALPPPAWTWPDRPGVAGCTAEPGVVAVAQTGGKSLFVLRPADGGAFNGDPQTVLANVYGRLAAAASGPDGLLWLGTVNRDGGAKAAPVPSDDRVIRIQPPSGGGADRA